MLKNLFSSFKKPSEPAVFTGNCPVKEHTADGHYVGRCEHSTYNNCCPRHGNLTIKELTENNMDDRYLPNPENRDYGNKQTRQKLGKTK